MEFPERQKVQMLSELAEANRMMTGLENLVSSQSRFAAWLPARPGEKARPR